VSIIVEGPDGAGKTTLVSDLHGHFPNMELHPRFCTSKDGPIAELSEAVYRDVKTKPTHFIYDRHPTVSEYVYNTAIPERIIRPSFLSDSMGRVRSRVARHSLLIWCLPPFPEVKRNTERDAEDQMPGVVENIDRIYTQYLMHRIMWPGRSVVYDYTRSEASWEALRYALSDTKDKLWKDAP
jgi:hypothetical protein